jgi:hypothetical protein
MDKSNELDKPIGIVTHIRNVRTSPKQWRNCCHLVESSQSVHRPEVYREVGHSCTHHKRAALPLEPARNKHHDELDCRMRTL